MEQQTCRFLDVQQTPKASFLMYSTKMNVQEYFNEICVREPSTYSPCLELTILLSQVSPNQIMQLYLAHQVGNTTSELFHCSRAPGFNYMKNGASINKETTKEGISKSFKIYTPFFWPQVSSNRTGNIYAKPWKLCFRMPYHIIRVF